MRIVQIDDALKAVSILRMFAQASEPAAGTLDLELLKLLREGGPVLRAELAEQLAHLTSGPPRTIRALAHDSYPEVAGPILQYSRAISDAALAEMARCKGDEHLKSIAGRPHLNAKITGILARRGGAQVLKTLASNKTAAFSAEGRHRLQVRLKQHELASRRAERRGLNQRFGDRVLAEAGAMQVAGSR